ncbi:hypothetical protein NQ318_013661 [Aromia moschata]|uniref:Uncharacterized protein n=1 Tax=Aromia moschata TaxID=1265417 RepID=A0AAV8Y146_9CUCU|nr:hypothetical protein NQ318_013661 [Aromia moschata]
MTDYQSGPALQHTFGTLYDGEYFQQHEGTAMANSLSPFIANLFMSKFETEVRDKVEYFPRVWFSGQLDAFESLEIIKRNSSMNKDNGPIPTSPLFALLNKDSYGSVNRGHKFSINSANLYYWSRKIVDPNKTALRSSRSNDSRRIKNVHKERWDACHVLEKTVRKLRIGRNEAPSAPGVIKFLRKVRETGLLMESSTFSCGAHS